MSDKLLDLDGLENEKLKGRRGKFQKKKSYIKYFKSKIKYTEPERAVQTILTKLGIGYTTQYQVETKFYDIYIPKLNLLIEVDGTYWHAKDIEYSKMNKIQQKSYLNDKIKDGLATKHGFKLIRIWEDEISVEKIRALINEIKENDTI